MSKHIAIQAVYTVVRHSSNNGWTEDNAAQDQQYGTKWLEQFWSHHGQDCVCSEVAASETISLVGGELVLYNEVVICNL